MTAAADREKGLGVAAELLATAGEMLADHMTSERHHPGYVLVPTAAFERMRATVAKAESPRDAAGVFNDITHRPIMWAARGVTHAVAGADVHPGVRLLWTRCEIDVPAGKAFLPGDGDTVDCPRCLAKAEGR